jgi:hypothetical protein
VPTPTPVATPLPAQTPPPTEPQTPPTASLLDDPGRIASLVGIVLALMVAVGALAASVAWFAGFRGLSPISGLYARSLRAGRWLGVPAAPSLTPNEYAERVGRMAPSAQGPARVVAGLYTEERYAGRRPSQEATRAAKDAWRELRGIAIGSLLRGKRGGSVS